MPILGTLNATEQGIKFSWSPTQGSTTERTFKGGEMQIKSAASYYQALGWGTTVTQLPGSIWQLQCNYGGDDGSGGAIEQVPNTWEFQPNKVQKALLESDNDYVKLLNDENIENINYYLAHPPAPGSTLTSLFTNTGNRSAAITVYQLMHRGMEHVPVFQPILRHTWQVPKGVSPVFAFTYSGKLLSDATMYALEGVPADFLLPIQTLPGLFPPPIRADGIVMVYAWFKNMPTLTIGANGRREVVQEWEYGLWPTAILQNPI